MYFKENVYPTDSADHFNDYDKRVDVDKFKDKSLIAGHIDYDDIVPKVAKTHMIMTILREPVSRCISWYKYSTLISNENINVENKSLPLEDICLSKHRLNTMYVHNTMTWMLGDHLDPTRRTKTPEEALQRAKIALISMDDILFFSSFTDGVAQLVYKYNLHTNLHKIPWVNPTVWMQPEVTDEAIRNLEKANLLDTELYQWAIQRRII
jgi:hypothetical protein